MGQRRKILEISICHALHICLLLQSNHFLVIFRPQQSLIFSSLFFSFEGATAEAKKEGFNAPSHTFVTIRLWSMNSNVLPVFFCSFRNLDRQRFPEFRCLINLKASLERQQFLGLARTLKPWSLQKIIRLVWMLGSCQRMGNISKLLFENVTYQSKITVKKGWCDFLVTMAKLFAD